ncbi:anthranilate synthase component II [Patescibacteria group bacterium]
MQKILLIDNFDSFTYNLFQQIKSLKQCEVIVKRNDQEITPLFDEFDKFVISPGPKTPKDAGISKSLIGQYYKTKPILGVCLGMQCINEVFGGETVASPLPVHGKTSNIQHTQNDLFNNIENNIDVARYHSLIIDDIPACLNVVAWTNDKIPMAIKHKDYEVYGVQFHPESFMTEYGAKLMFNFLNL